MALTAAILLLLPRFAGNLSHDGSLLTIKAGLDVKNLIFISDDKLITNGIHRKPAKANELPTRSIKTWYVQDGKPIIELNTGFSGIVFSSDRKFFLDKAREVQSQLYATEVVKISDHSLIGRWPDDKHAWESNWALSPGGTLAAAAVLKNPSRNFLKPEIKTLSVGGIQTWDATTGKKLWFAEESHSKEGNDLMPLSVFLTYSPNQELLAEASEVSLGGDSSLNPRREFKSRLLLRNAKTGQILRVLMEGTHIKIINPFQPSSFWHSLSFSPDGKYLLSLGGKADFTANSTNHDSIYLWEVATGRLKWQVNRPKIEPNCAQFSPDGSFIAVGDEILGRPDGFRGGMISLWELETGKHLNSFNRETNVDYAAYCVDSKIQAIQRSIKNIIPANRTYVRYKLASDKSSPVTGLSFTPDGKRLASLHYDNIVKIWPIK